MGTAFVKFNFEDQDYLFEGETAQQAILTAWLRIREKIMDNNISSSMASDIVNGIEFVGKKSNKEFL